MRLLDLYIAMQLLGHLVFFIFLIALPWLLRVTGVK